MKQDGTHITPVEGKNETYTTTRRGILAAVAGVGSFITAPAIAIDATEASDAAVSAAFARHLDCLSRQILAEEQHRVELEGLPEWVRPGPACINSRGESCGHISSEPMVANYTVPEHDGVTILVRPSVWDIKERTRFSLDIFGRGPADRKSILRAHRMRMTLYRERVREAEVLKARANAIMAEIDALETEMFGLETAIREASLSANKAAALVMLEHVRGGINNGSGSIRLCTLSALQPMLSGSVASAAGWFIAHPEAKCPACIGQVLQAVAEARA